MRVLIDIGAALGGLIAFSSALMLLWFAAHEIGFARRRHREQADTEPWQPGDHEYCELTDDEQLWFDYFTHRYPGLGREAQR